MKTILLLALLIAGQVSAQVIGLMPTNYNETILTQNNVGRLLPYWYTDAQDDIVLSERTLVLSHSVFFRSAHMGSKYGAPKRIEEVFVYRQIGGDYYRPVGGRSIIYYAQKAAGPGWISSTNIFRPELMDDLHWSPTFIGYEVTGDNLWRKATAGSALTCHGINLSNTPYLISVVCVSPPVAVYYRFRFGPSESKFIKFDMGGVNSILNTTSIDCFTFDLDSFDYQPVWF